MKLEYETVRFEKVESSEECEFACLDRQESDERIGTTYYGGISGDYYYLTGAFIGHTPAQLRDIADFLDQLKSEDTP